MNASIQRSGSSLEDSWSIWGSRVTVYRDCIHHYVPVDFGMASIVMEEALPGVWTALAANPRQS